MRNDNIIIIVNSGKIKIPKQEIVIQEDQCKKCGKKIFHISYEMNAHNMEKISVWTLKVTQLNNKQFIMHNLVCLTSSKKRKRKKRKKAKKI